MFECDKSPSTGKDVIPLIIETSDVKEIIKINKATNFRLPCLQRQSFLHVTLIFLRFVSVYVLIILRQPSYPWDLCCENCFQTRVLH